jgi:hypothetical protein
VLTLLDRARLADHEDEAPVGGVGHGEDGGRQNDREEKDVSSLEAHG